MLMLRKFAESRTDLWAMLCAAAIAALLLIAATQLEAQTLTTVATVNGVRSTTSTMERSCRVQDTHTFARGVAYGVARQPLN